MRLDLILRVATKLILPFMLLFALYVQFHGDYGAGGGFQAGTIAGAGVILYALVFGLAADAADRAAGAGRDADPARRARSTPRSAWPGWLTGGNYLEYNHLAHDPVHGAGMGRLPGRGRRVRHRQRDHGRDLLRLHRAGAVAMREMLDLVGEFLAHYNQYITIFLMVSGLYIVIARGNMVKKLVGLSLFQTSVYLLYISAGKVTGGTAPIIDPRFTVYSHPLPHVLILTAIVVGIATLALGLALVVRINEAYGTIEEDEIFDRDKDREMREHLPALQVVLPLFGASLAALVRRPLAAWLVTVVVSVALPRRRRVLLREVLAVGVVSYRIGGWDPSLGIEYRVDIVNALILVLVAAIAVVVAPSRGCPWPPRSRRTRSPGSTPCTSWR